MPPGGNDEPYRCPNCGRELKTVAGFRRHLERHVQRTESAAADTNSSFEPCADAPIGVVTNCAAMKCERNGCAVAAAKAAPPVSLDDLTIPTRRDCQCPNPNPDCEHPTCPRWPQPGHFYAEAAELVGAWETDGKGYLDLEWRIAAALAKAAKR